MCIAALGTGCQHQTYQRQMLDYINEKYQDAFTYIEPYGGAIGSEDKFIFVENEKYAGERILVGCTLENGRATDIRDNLPAILLREELVTELERIVVEVYGDGRVFFRTPHVLLPADFDERTSLEEYTSYPGGQLTATFLIRGNGETSAADADTLREKLAESQIKLSGVIAYVSDDAAYEELDWDAVNNLLSTDDGFILRGYFALNDQHEFIYLDWRQISA